jgi:hypothetical protein
MSSLKAASILQFLRDRFNKRTLAFLACIVLSALFWLLTSLSKEYVGQIEIPIIYTDIPEDLVMVNEPVLKATAEVKGVGFDLLWHSFKLEEFELDVSVQPTKMKRTRKNGSEFRYVLTGNANGGLTSVYNDRFNILSVSPDTLFFEFKPKHSKVVPVVLNATMTFAKQFGTISAPQIEPDSVMIIGPKEMIDTISFVRTEHQKWNDLSESLNVEVKLQKARGLSVVQFDHEQVMVDLNVVEFTEGSVVVPLNVKAQNAKAVQVFPQSVEIKYMVALDQYDQVKAGQFQASVTVDGESAKNSRLMVTLNQFPEIVSQCRVLPAQVEFIIQK